MAGKTGAKRADGNATKRKILNAARSVIIEEGTDRLTIDAVIARAKISKGAFLYHYPSRRHLIEALAADYARHLEEMRAELAASAEPGVPGMLSAYLSWYEGFLPGGRDDGASPFLGIVMASCENRNYLEPIRQWYRRYYDHLIKKASELPCGPCGNPAELDALVFTMAVDGLFFHRILDIDVLTDDEKQKLIELLQMRIGFFREQNPPE